MNKALIALALIAVLITAGCGADPSQAPTVPDANPTNAQAQPPGPSPSPQASPAPEEEVGLADVVLEWREDYQDTLAVDALTPVDILGRYEASVPTLPADAGWQMLGQSTKQIDGSLLSVDDYQGQWLMALDETPDRLSQLIIFTPYDLYTCQEDLPIISEVALNDLGAHWIEHNDASWRLMQMPLRGGEAVELAGGSLKDGLLPRVTSPGTNALVLYEPSEGRLRTLGEEGGALSGAAAVHTLQVDAPEAVSGHVAWIEETSRGWAAATLDTMTGQTGGFLLEGVKRPIKATYDGELLLVHSISGALYGYDSAADKVYFVCSGVSSYQHVPGDGAVVAVRTSWEDQLVRFHLGPDGQPYLMPLMAVKDGGRVVRSFHQSYELDVEMFLVERDGSFEQTTISMRRLEE